ncbi:MAG: hypothetical protein NT020_02640 [Chloroflexales bacterium]|nr:hypothetical protein [Chloroflexales bacterium]
MNRLYIAPIWRWPLATLVLLLVAANHIVSARIIGVALLAVGIGHAVVIIQRIRQQQRIGNVTYWRGVRYETPSRGGFQWSDLRDQGLFIVSTVIALLIGLALV